VKVRTRLTLWYTVVLLATLVVISTLSYSLLAWSLTKDIDASLLAVGEIIRNVGWDRPDMPLQGTQAAVREILGPEFYDKFLRLIDPDGRPRAPSTFFAGHTAPLSTTARRNAMRGRSTFETVRLAHDEGVCLLTMPVTRDGQLAQIVQVGIPLTRTHQTLQRYLQTLLILVPIGLALAATGGALTARAALARSASPSRPDGAAAKSSRSRGARLTGAEGSCASSPA
jgi:hypothetical protein